MVLAWNRRLLLRSAGMAVAALAWAAPSHAIFALLPSTVEVQSLANPASLGESVLFIARVTSPAPGLTGTLAFKDNGAVIAGCGPAAIADTSSNPDSSAAAFCSTSALTAGTHAITAEYSGNGNIAPGVSSPLTQTVLTILPFPFASKDDVGLGAMVTSDPVTLSGFTGTLSIAVEGGRYSIGCVEPYTTTPATVSAGTAVCVRHVTPLALGTSTTTFLFVGGISSAFSSTTSNVSPLTPPATIAAGISHNLVIAYDVANDNFDAVWGWGDNTAGKLGNGVTVSSSIPVRSRYAYTMSVAAGMSHSLALDFSGNVYAWGSNGTSQLGIDPFAYGSDACAIPGQFGPNPDFTFPCLTSPVAVTGLDHVVAVSAGWGHSLALKSDGTVWAWGSGVYGQNGSSFDRVVPEQVPINGMVTRIAAGYMHSVALLSDGTVVAWGSGNHGELGPATLAQSHPAPVAVTGLAGVTDIAAGGGFTLARKSDLSLVAWGANVYGTLGDSTIATHDAQNNPGFRQAPGPVVNMTDVTEFTAGFGFALARKGDGSVWSWGLNKSGQVNGVAQTAPQNCGTAGSRSCVRTPTQVPSLGGAIRLAAGGAHTMTVRPSDALVVIGDNGVGQHGDESGNFGVPLGPGLQPFLQPTYDPDNFIFPGGTFGTGGGVGTPSTTGGLNLGTIGEGLTFPAQGVGIPAPALVVTLRNLLASTPIVVSSVSAAGTLVPGEFAASGCVGTLSAGASCDINIQFDPADLGARPGALTIASNAAGSPTISYPLYGTGIDLRVASSTAVVSNATPVLAGASVTFTATVTASTAPTGSMSFMDGGVAIGGCAAVALASGTASCSTNSLTAGSHAITAAYSGSGSVLPSISAAISQAVLAAFPLSVAKSGAGSGSVTSTPAGIICGATCSALFVADAVVTLSAAPSPGSAFAGWSGDCSGMNSCIVSMSAARNVTAAFAVSVGTTPNAFTFADQVNVQPGAAITSNAITVSGISAPAQIAVANGAYSIGCTGTFVTATATITNAQTVCVRHTAALALNAATNTTLNIGGVSDTFTSTTIASLPAGDFDGDGIPNDVELVEGRNPLVKDNDVFSQARLFTMQQYRDFLNREGDAAGINGWVGLLAGGTYDQLHVIDAFLSSQEFSGFVAPVVRLYFATFLRVPDYAGLVFNAGLVRAGTVTVVQLADFFTVSPEFQATYGALNDTQFVTLLYNNVLGRAPDAAGLAGWASLLQGGYTRGQVLVGFSESVEYQASSAYKVFVTMMYAGMLHRTPEIAGFNGWVGFLDSHTYTRTQVINGFFLSIEYHARFLP